MPVRAEKVLLTGFEPFGTLGGFIHVPYQPEQTQAMYLATTPPSMPLERITAALRSSVVTALSSALQLGQGL